MKSPVLDFVAAVEDNLECYRVSVSPVQEEEFDCIVTARKIFDGDASMTHAYNLGFVNDFIREHDCVEVRTGVNNSVNVYEGVSLGSYADNNLRQHWVEFRVSF